MRIVSRPCLALLACMWVTNLRAATTEQGHQTAISPDEGNLSAADTMPFEFREQPLTSVLQWLSNRTGKTIVSYDPPCGDLTVISGSALSAKETEQVLNAAVGESRLKLMRYPKFRPDVLVLIPSNWHATSFPCASSKQPTHAFKLSSPRAEEMKHSIVPFMSRTASCDSIADNLLVLSGEEARIRTLLGYVRRLDDTPPTHVFGVLKADRDAPNALESLQSRSDVLAIVDDETQLVLVAASPEVTKTLETLKGFSVLR